LSLPGISSSHGRYEQAAPHSLGNFDRRVLQAMFGKKEKPAKREGFIKRLRARINKGDSWLTYDLANLVPGGKIDEDSLDELESLLVMADVGIDTTTRIIEDLQKSLARKELTDLESLRNGLQRSIVGILEPVEQPLEIGTEHQPFVILMVGVNGAGKTTTIGKLARRFQDQGLSVMLAAGDTFRAAAVEQLQVWGERNDVTVIAQQSGADPAAVIFDAWEAAKARDIDVLLADTAGRLQNQQGLMDELAKIKRVIARRDETAPHEIMLVLDASQGQNALVQAQKFNDALGLTGITVTKLDGSAKGGILLAVANELQVPVRFIGIGESAEDMQPFVAEEFADALLSSGEQG
jgi:fused signal recognition particle receptor